jgi:uncharacterized protein (DUF1697 family)
VALLRGINLGGNRTLPMAELRALLERLGLDEPRTVLQSGNVVFRARAEPAALERRLREETRAALGVDTEYFVRSAEEWRGIVGANPFPGEAARDPARLHVMLCEPAVRAADVAALDAAITGRESVRGAGRHLYAYYPDGMGRSRLTTAVIDRSLRTRTTARNWNTVLRLLALVES